MRIRILGCGWYGAHLGVALLADGHDVTIQESADRVFAGASGNNPARLHIGPHYPRSAATRASCLAHHAEFMAAYGQFTRAVATNLYAIAAEGSLLDFATYRKVLAGEIEFITVERPADFGLRRVEGAILCAERHIVIDEVRQHFAGALFDRVVFGARAEAVHDDRWDLTIDATFCALDGARVHRYEPCLMAVMERRGGRAADTAVTVMDGPVGASLYPWDGCLASLTTPSLTPLARTSSRETAERVLRETHACELELRAEQMVGQLRAYWPAVEEYEVVDLRLSIRAQPASAADARFVDLVQVGPRAWRVRAGKIVNVFEAERRVKALIASGEWRAAA